ncbi:MAG: hypothetical protein AB7S81_01755 [Bdellovibrionales bacterium]
MFRNFLTTLATNAAKKAVDFSKETHFGYVQKAITKGKKKKKFLSPFRASEWVYTEGTTIIKLSQSPSSQQQQTETIVVRRDGEIVWKSTLRWPKGTSKEHDFTDFQVQSTPVKTVSCQVPCKKLHAPKP